MEARQFRYSVRLADGSVHQKGEKLTIIRPMHDGLGRNGFFVRLLSGQEAIVFDYEIEEVTEHATPRQPV